MALQSEQKHVERSDLMYTVYLQSPYHQTMMMVKYLFVVCVWHFLHSHLTCSLGIAFSKHVLASLCMAFVLALFCIVAFLLA